MQSLDISVAPCKEREPASIVFLFQCRSLPFWALLCGMFVKLVKVVSEECIECCHHH